MDFGELTRFQERLWDYGIAGNDVCVCASGKCVYRHMTGYSNIEAGERIRPDTIYQMYSMTKPITCVAALQLYERGAFLMDQPLSEFFSEFEHMYVKRTLPNGETDIVPARSKILIQDLFTMSSGFNYNFNTPAFSELIQQNPNFTTRDAARALSKSPLDFEPGTHWQYGLSHDVLGALIELWSGMRFSDYLKKYIFEPLGMADACFRLPEESKPRRAGVYEWRLGERAHALLPQDNVLQFGDNFESGGAGLNMTVDDYARFANALCMRGVSPDTGARILSDGIVRAMRENVLDDARLSDFRQNPTRAGYGYGLGVRTLMSPGRAASAGMPGEFGWGGMAGTYFLVDPVARVTLVYAQQSIPGQNGYTHRRLRNLMYRALES